MTKERARYLIPLLQAYIDGKTIQVLQTDGKWSDRKEPAFIQHCNENEYRIKPEPREFWVAVWCDGSGDVRKTYEQIESTRCEPHTKSKDSKIIVNIPWHETCLHPI